MSTVRTTIAVVASLACVLGAFAGEPTAAPHTEKGHLYDRVAVIGASASDGFGVVVKEAPGPEGAPRAAEHLNLAKILRHAAPKSEGAPVIHHYASGFFFASPGTVGRGEIDRALKAHPTLVIALDYLFWWVYGTVDASGEPMRDEAARVANLESGLAQLDRVLADGIPVVVGDLPNMRDATGRVLSKAQVPTAETLATVNARIAEWVGSRPGARLFPLASLHQALKRGERIVLAGETWDPAKWGRFVQSDELHPTFAGAVAIASGIAERAREFDPESPTPWRFDPDAIRTTALQQAREKPGASEPQRIAP